MAFQLHAMQVSAAFKTPVAVPSVGWAYAV